MTTVREEGEWSVSRLGRFLPPGKTRYPLYRRLSGPQGRSGQVRKISPPTGIRSPGRPARSQSLYRISYPAHTNWKEVSKNRADWEKRIKEAKVCIGLLCHLRRISVSFLMKQQEYLPEQHASGVYSLERKT